MSAFTRVSKLNFFDWQSHVEYAALCDVLIVRRYSLR